jgi:hypothetical protein
MAQTDGNTAPKLIDKAVPDMTAVVDDIGVGLLARNLRCNAPAFQQRAIVRLAPAKGDKIVDGRARSALCEHLVAEAGTKSGAIGARARSRRASCASSGRRTAVNSSARSAAPD